jgi:hypothetical protein
VRQELPKARLTFIIFFMEKARLMVTASGRPSGTATTRMVTAKMKNCSGPDENFEIGKPWFSIIHLLHEGRLFQAVMQGSTHPELSGQAQQ